MEHQEQQIGLCFCSIVFCVMGLKMPFAVNYLQNLDFVSFNEILPVEEFHL